MKALRWYENYLLPVTNLWESVEISENLCENFADLLRMYISTVLLRPPPFWITLERYLRRRCKRICIFGIGDRVGRTWHSICYSLCGRADAGARLADCQWRPLYIRTNHQNTISSCKKVISELRPKTSFRSSRNFFTVTTTSSCANSSATP